MPSKMRMRKNVAVHDSLDACGKFNADQGEIWDMIHEKSERFEVDSPTSAMGAIYDHEQDITDDYMKHFTVKDNQVGILVMINNQVIGCDLAVSGAVQAGAVRLGPGTLVTPDPSRLPGPLLS